MLTRAEQAFGQVDILVSNYAAGVPRKSFADSSWTEWQEQIDTTLKAAFVCCQTVLPAMKERRWGRIISVNTIGIHQPGPSYHGYTSAKTAMLGFTRNLAVEVGPYNITGQYRLPRSDPDPGGQGHADSRSPRKARKTGASAPDRNGRGHGQCGAVFCL